MSKTDKGTAPPPTYEEAMHYTPINPVIVSSPSPQIGLIYPNAVSVGIHQPTAPPQTQIHTAGYVPSYGAFETTPVSVVLQPEPVPEIIVIGGCPACRIGYLEDSFSCLGLFCAIAFFPIGILCCLAMKTKHCTTCGAEF